MTDRNRTIALLLAFPGLMGLLAGSAAHGSPSLAPQIRSAGTLGTRNLFPMHQSGRENRLAKDARSLVDEGVTIPIHAAGRPGDRFLFTDGVVRRVDPSRPERTGRLSRPAKGGKRHGLE
jgi:hypothetical protein